MNTLTVSIAIVAVALILAWFWLAGRISQKIYHEPKRPDELQIQIRNEVGLRMKEIYFVFICTGLIALTLWGRSISSGIDYSDVSSVRLGTILFLLGSLVLEKLMKRRLLRRYLGEASE